MKNKKLFILISIIVISVLLIIGLVFFLVKDELKNISSSNSDDGIQVYGVVVEKGNNYLLVEGVDDKKYYVAGENDADVGTFVEVTYNKKADIDKGAGVVDVVLRESETKIVEDLTTSPNTYLDKDELATTETTKTTSKRTTKSTTTTKKTTYKYTTNVSDDEIVSYAANTYSEVREEGVLDKAKSGFITLVDFIFYDGEIKGKKFDELTAAAKAKVVYYTLLIDGGIESKWPNYKENIHSKYDNIKDKLVAKYMDLTTSICANSSDSCQQAKSDFKLMKESIKLTWNTLKRAFSYAFDKGKTSISEWYKVFSGKA